MCAIDFCVSDWMHVLCMHGAQELYITHTTIYISGMPLGLLKKVGKYRVWGQIPEARAIFQSELPRKLPIDTHGHYTYNTCNNKKKKKKEKKVGTSEKV